MAITTRDGNPVVVETCAQPERHSSMDCWVRHLNLGAGEPEPFTREEWEVTTEHTRPSGSPRKRYAGCLFTGEVA
jgi:hypothetical protein